MVATRDWHAWLNTQPPPPDDLHVIGQVEVANPGVVAFLVPSSPQGINPAILMLELHLVQRPGFWPAVITWTPAHYDRVYPNAGDRPSQVSIMYGGNSIQNIPVDVVG
ncbi:MAG: hypothetical protein WAU68_09455 [Vitreimonas sp.]